MDILLDSLRGYIADFSANKAIMLIMVVFMIVGGVDRIRGNKLGYGERFEAGFEAMGTLATAMVGMIALVPVIKIVLGGVLGKFFALIGCDPSIFAGLLLGMDLGGYPLAMELAETPVMGSFTGIVVASVMGINVVFNIPVGMGIIEEGDRKYLASGMLIGFATIPIGCILGGLTMIGMGFDITVGQVIMNTIPVAVVAVLIILGLLLIQEKMLKGFIAFGKGVTIVVTCATVLAVFQYLTGIRLPLFHVMVEPNAEGVVPLLDGIQVVGGIALVLLGAFPMVTFITRNFSGALQKAGAKIGLDETSVAGLIANVANNIPMYQMMKDMSPKGKIVNCAFTVSAAFVLGDHLGFCANADQSMILPMIAAKFLGGVTAVILALLLWKRFLPQEERQ
ncbi:MAG: ethanolamine utilization protein EutH [Firmicutes bacterium]|nr:ethanolamine utilization protein EutH [Bacillota bacterium]MBR2783127.1 ethanolamine utilization protein EutH [Bacillota bacterium]